MTKLELILDQLTMAENDLKELSNEENQLIFDYVEYAKILVKELIIGGVSSCYLIDDKKPRTNQPILYMGNHGLTDGTYRNYADGVGWVLLPNGGLDCFDEWLPNNC